MKLRKTSGMKRQLSTPIRYLISILIYIFVFSIFMITAAFITNMLKDPLSYVKISAYSALAVSVFVSAVISSKIIDGGVFGNFVCGLIFAVILFLSGLTDGKADYSPAKVLMTAIIPLLSVFAAFVSVKKPKKKRIKSMYKKYR